MIVTSRFQYNANVFSYSIAIKKEYQKYKVGLAQCVINTSNKNYAKYSQLSILPSSVNCLLMYYVRC